MLELTQSILAKAFRGELAPQDPNDEPASALLGRIRQTGNNVAHQRKLARLRSYASYRDRPGERDLFVDLDGAICSVGRLTPSYAISLSSFLI